METKAKNLIPLITTPKKVKYLHVNLTKHVNDLDAENYKMQIKEIKDVEHMGWKFQHHKAVNSSQIDL